jgi:hypothetical protein
MRTVAASIGCGLALLASQSATAQGVPSSNARGELSRFAELLEVAVGEVSRPSPFQVLGPAAAGSGYLVPGYGAIFVLPARMLPGDGGVIVMQEGQPGSQPVISVWRRDVRRLQKPKDGARARPEVPEVPELKDLDRDIQQIEGLVEAYSREAELASREAEKALERVAQEIRSRFPEMETPPSSVSAPRPPAPPATPVAAPAAPRAPTPPAAPPWRFWFQADDVDDPRPAARVVSDVQGALIYALETRGAALTVVRPEDFVIVAVDFTVRGFPLWAERRAERTLVVKAKKQDLDERRAGRLAAEELRKRIVALEY